MGDELAATAATQTSGEGQPPGGATPPSISFEDALAALDRHLQETPERRKEFRSSRVAMSVAGDVAQYQRQVEQQQAAQEAITREKNRLKELRKSDPIAYAEEMDTREELAEKQAELAAVQTTTRKQFTDSIGEALQAMPEFSELTQADVDGIAAKMKGIPEDKVVGVFFGLATDVISTKRSQKTTKAEADKAVAEAKKVWEADRRTERLQGRRAPSIVPPSNGNAVTEDTEPAWPSKEWEAWDKRQQKAGRGIYDRSRYQRRAS